MVPESQQLGEEHMVGYNETHGCVCRQGHLKETMFLLFNL